MNNIDKIADFVLKNYRPFNRVALIERIKKHLVYGTYVLIGDENGIAAFCMFNIRANTAHILGIVIRKDLRSKGLIKLVASKLWHKFPYINWFIFDREEKYKDKKVRYTPIVRFLGIQGHRK